MSRAAVKSQAERNRLKSTTPQNQDIEVEDIIPGHLTQRQWTDMMMEEDVEEVVGEIMTDLLSQVMEACSGNDVKRRLASFSASWAKSHLIQILEQKFLCRDEGDGPEEASQTEDLEPTPATPDVRARGCLPVQHAAPSSKCISRQDLGQTQPRANQHRNITTRTSSLPKPPEKEKSPSKPVADLICNVFRHHTPQNIHGNEKHQNSLPPKPVASTFLPSLSCSADRRSTGYKNQALSTESTQHKRHQVLSLPRLVLANSYTESDLKKPSGRSELEADIWRRKSSLSRERRGGMMS